MNKGRVKAFTIIELTVAMLISAIAIGITYTIFSIISRSYGSFNKKNEHMAEVSRLDELLRKDFERSELVLKDTSSIAFQSLNKMVRYKFDTAYVVRIGLITDTFKVRTDTVNTLFENEIVNEPALLKEQNRLDQLDLSIALQNEKITYHYHKIYSSTNLINRNPDAVN
ncbi:MAG TPA: prepilin-type N-terminal cleavage/methylation domain-containing protein [Mucilaginibacter sp.]|nr:prepilin-type N-terminal cleavage/methylation domain-containing protein [Mucilaginibacter sp.]